MSTEELLNQTTSPQNRGEALPIEASRPWYEWYIDCIQKSFSFTGRARRMEYWMFQLTQGIICIGVFVFGVLLIMGFGGAATQANEAAGVAVVMTVYSLMLGFFIISYLPGLAVCVRRIHDLDVSGWLMLLALVPGGNIGLFVMMCLKGKPGKNSYGSDPLESNAQTGNEFLAGASSSYIRGLCIFSFFCPVIGLLLWASTKKTLLQTSKKFLAWSAVGIAITSVIAIALGLAISASGALYY